MQIAFKLWIHRGDLYKFLYMYMCISFARYIYFYLYFIDICRPAALQLLFMLDWHLIAFQRTAVIFARSRGVITIRSRIYSILKITL